MGWGVSWDAGWDRGGERDGVDLRLESERRTVLLRSMWWSTPYTPKLV